MHEVFVSHATNDIDVATRVSSALEHCGCAVFIAPKSIRQADWQQAIGDALERCDWFVVLMSPSAERSKWLKREREARPDAGAAQ